VNLRIVFMGSPEFAAPTLQALHSNFQVVGVVTQRDRPKGRGRKIIPTAVKAAALALDIPVVDPDRLDDAFMAALEEWKPDVIVVAAFGKILPKIVLDYPRFGCVNLHGSLLPRYRGASPIAGAILAGDTTTGVSTMLMDEGMDTGAILLQTEIPIGEDDTTGSLQDKMMEPGARLVVETLRHLTEGRVQPVPQDNSKATYCDLLTKEDGRLHWNKNAFHLARLVRAMNPWPGAFFVFSGERIKVWSASAVPGKGRTGVVSSVRSDGVLVGTATGELLIKEVQAPGKKRVAAAEFARGRHVRQGDSLGTDSEP
jgi:methionyl-tRNA formyltransferase